MNVHFTARQTVLTPEIKAYVEKRLQRLKRLLGPEAEIDIVLASEKSRLKVEIRLVNGGPPIVEETAEALSSLNLAFDHLERTLRTRREKGRERKRRGGRERKIPPVAEDAAEPRRKIVRSDDYAGKPMSLDEAVLRFETSKKEVLVFRNQDSDSGDWAVLYRRKDGHYGLVEPE